jgi:hypothetical protein
MVVDPGSAKLGLASDIARTGGGGLDGGTDAFGSKLHLASALRGRRSRLAGIIRRTWRISRTQALMATIRASEAAQGAIERCSKAWSSKL